MIEQLYFSFENKKFHSIYDIIIGSYNLQLMNFLFNNTSMLNHLIFISSPHKVGKSFISNIFINHNKGTKISLIDNMEDINKQIAGYQMLLLDNLQPLNNEQQEKLFYIYNLTLAQNKKLIINSRYDLNNLNITLHDLKSRLNAGNIFYLADIDEEILKVILFKTLLDKQIVLSKNVIEFIFNKISRNLESVINVSQLIEKYIMTENKKVSLKNISRILESLTN